MDWLIFRIRFTLKGFAAYEKNRMAEVFIPLSGGSPLNKFTGHLYLVLTGGGFTFI